MKSFIPIPSTNLNINPFLANVYILYPLKTPENQRFSGVFRGYKIGTLTRNGLSSVFSHNFANYQKILYNSRKMLERSFRMKTKKVHSKPSQTSRWSFLRKQLTVELFSQKATFSIFDWVLNKLLNTNFLFMKIFIRAQEWLGMTLSQWPEVVWKHKLISTGISAILRFGYFRLEGIRDQSDIQVSFLFSVSDASGQKMQAVNFFI